MDQQVQIQKYSTKSFLRTLIYLQGTRKVGATPQRYFKHGSSAVPFDWSRCGTVV
jgi:hypothetical protein